VIVINVKSNMISVKDMIVAISVKNENIIVNVRNIMIVMTSVVFLILGLICAKITVIMSAMYSIVGLIYVLDDNGKRKEVHPER
jgi:hypothetical protein